METSKSRDNYEITIIRSNGMNDFAKAAGVYTAACYDKDGNLKWEENFDNVVTTVGANHLLNQAFGATQNTTYYLGLISSTSYTAVSTTVSSLTSYSSTTGLVTLVVTANPGLNPGDSFTIASATGTGTNFASVNGTWTAAAGTSGTTITFYTSTGLTITTLTGGTFTATGTKAGDTMGTHAGWLEAGTTNAPQWTTPSSGARAAVTWNAAASRSKAIASAASFTISGAGTIQGCFIVTASGAVATNLDTNGTLYSAGVFSAAKVVTATDVVNVSYSTSV